MKVGKLSGWSVLILPWSTLVTAKVYQVLSKISAHSKSILWLLLHWDCSISQYHIQSKMFDDFVFFDGKRWWQFARISILRIEKRLIIERKCYLRFIMTLRRFFFIHYISVCTQILFLEIPIKEFWFTLRDI